MYSSRSGMLYLIRIKITLCDLHLRFFYPVSFSLAIKITQVSVKGVWIFMMLNPVVMIHGLGGLGEVANGLIAAACGAYIC